MVTDLEVYIADLKQEIETQKEQRRWIPVTERLPENENGVLVAGHTTRTSTNRFVDTGWFDRGEDHWDGWNLGVMDIVTHWQELPQPPREDAG